MKVTVDTDSLARLMAWRALDEPRGVAFRHKARGAWHDVTWSELAARVDNIACGLVETGVRPGDCIVVAAPASPAWLLAILGVNLAGALPLSLYQALAPPDIAAVFKDQCVNGAIGELGWIEMLHAAGVKLPRLVAFTDQQRPAEWSGGPILMLADLEERGRGGAPPSKPDEPAAPAILFATAGSGGTPKVVVHSSRSLLAAARTLADVGRRPLGRADSTVVELPTGHLGALLTAIILPLACGVVAYLPEVRPADAIRDVHPTFSINLAGIWERTGARIQVAARGTRGLKGLALQLAQRFRRSELDPTQPLGPPRGPLAHLAYIFVFLPLVTKLGLERLRVAYVVGPTSPDELSIWQAFGVRIVQTYGLTEAGPLVACVSDGELKPAAGMETKVRQDGVVLVRGPAVGGAYRKNGQICTAVDSDGWLDTGDVGIVGTEYLRVMGHRTDVVQLPEGSASLALVDSTLRYSPYIRSACSVVSAQRIDAVLDLDFGSIASWATSNGISYRTPAALVETEAVNQLLQQELQEANGRLQRQEMPAVRSIAVTQERFAVGLDVTPVGSVRRFSSRYRRTHEEASVVIQ